MSTEEATDARLPFQRRARDQSPAPCWRSRTGRALTAFVAVFLAFDGVTHVLHIHAVEQSFRDLGYPVSSAQGIGVLELVCLALYLLPRSAPVGALLLTAYLGGAVSAQERISAPLLSTRLFPVYTAALMWVALALRDRRLSDLLLTRRSAT